jgi:hypothetical protein
LEAAEQVDLKTQLIEAYSRLGSIYLPLAKAQISAIPLASLATKIMNIDYELALKEGILAYVESNTALARLNFRATFNAMKDDYEKLFGVKVIVQKL